MAGTTPEDLRALVAADPGGTALFCDFDGTLAPIVADPPDARPVPGAVGALERLARRCRLVAVVSGRPLRFLDPLLPAPVRVAALYGLEQRVDGQAREHAEAAGWGPVVADVAGRARAELPAGAVVEEKSLSLTLHYRAAPELRPMLEAWAERASETSGLEVRPAKMSVELHPAVTVDKGTTVLQWAEGAEVVVFAGDDAGDLAAFAALAELRRAGRRTMAVAVASAESPPEVLAAADLVVDGPARLAELLGELADAVS